MIVVLDTNVLVAAVRSRRGASFGILSTLPTARFTMLLSVPLLLEYEAVLKRPTTLEASGLSGEDMDTILDMLAAVARPLRLHYLWRPQLADPADEMILELAVAGGADAIVTFNRGHFAGAARRFGLRVASPREFLSAPTRISHRAV